MRFVLALLPTQSREAVLKYVFYYFRCGLPLVAFPASFPLKPRTSSLGIATPTVGFKLPHLSLIKEMPYRLVCFYPSLQEAFSFFSDDDSLCQVDPKLASTPETPFAVQTKSQVVSAPGLAFKTTCPLPLRGIVS